MHNWEKILFGTKDESKKLLDYLASLPGPSPWSLKAGSKTFGEYEWEEAGQTGEKAGKILLNKQKQPILVLDFCNYVSKIDDNTLFIWRQWEGSESSSGPVIFTLLKLTELTPLQGDLGSLYKSQTLKSKGVYFEGDALVQFELSTLVVNEDVKYSFPAQVKDFGECFVLCSSTSIRVRDYKMSNLGLMLIDFKNDVFRIYPQEWYNTGSFDFLYQWVSKVGREPFSGEIVAEGVRIGAFVLKPDFSGIKNVL